jgi:hypothetical protein
MDLGYLVHKSPFRVHSFEQVFGKAHAFFPEASSEHSQASHRRESQHRFILMGFRKCNAEQLKKRRSFLMDPNGPKFRKSRNGPTK